MQPKPKMQRGVTLKELLAVCAIIIVISMTLLSPMRFGPNHRSRQAACSSNGKQIGLGLLQYAQDNDESLPVGAMAQDHPGSSRPGLGWAGQIYPYIKDVNVFRCPEDDTGDSIISYGYNSNVAGRTIAWKGTAGYLGSFTDPARTVAVFEVTNAVADVLLPDEGASQGAMRFSPVGDGTDGSLHSVQSGLDKAQYATGRMSRPFSSGSQFVSDKGRHTDGSNFLFADGHVKVSYPQASGVSTGTDAAVPLATQTGGVSGTAAGTANAAFWATFSVK